MPGRGTAIRTFRTYTTSLASLAEWLEAERVTDVVMEATGQWATRSTAVVKYVR